MLSIISIGSVLNNCSSQNKEVVKIGAVLPLTGPYALLGESEQKGLRLATEILNSSDSIYADKIDLALEDSKGQTNDAVAGAQKLMSAQRINYIITSLSGVSLAIKPIVLNNQGLQIAYAMDEKISQDAATVFRIYPSIIEEGQTILKYLKSKTSGRVAIVYFNSEVFEREVREVLEPGLKESMVQGIDIENFDDVSATRNIFAKLRQKKPNIIIINCYYTQYQSIFKILNEYDLLGSEIVGGLDLSIAINQDLLQDSWLDSVIVAAPLSNFITNDNTNNKPREYFLKKYEEKYNEPPIYEAAYAYDSLMLLVQAMNTSNSNDPAEVAKALRNIKNFQGATGNISILEDGNVKSSWVLGKIKEGDLIPIDENK